MKIIFLDQNKWIELSRVEVWGDDDPRMEPLKPLKPIYHSLCNAVESGEMLVPLSMSHLIETKRSSSANRRTNLARIQSRLSRGYVFRDRDFILQHEIRSVLKGLFKESVVFSDNWFMDCMSVEKLFSSLSDEDCQEAKKAFVDCMKNLIEERERERERLKDESQEMRRRVYAAQTILSNLEMIEEQLESIGRTYDKFKELGDYAFRRLTDNVATWHVERELACKLEAQKTRKLAPNDLADMNSFCAAVPYADWVISEKTFVQMANQCKLGEKYNTHITTDLLELESAF